VDEERPSPDRPAASRDRSLGATPADPGATPADPGATATAGASATETLAAATATATATAAPPTSYLPGAELAVGDRFARWFRIEARLGAGGMGVVYRARDLRLERDVALKLHLHGGHLERLRREAIAMARLQHPNIVTVHEVGEIGLTAFVVMDYIEGTTLRGWLEARPRRIDEILSMMLGAGRGLAAAHAAGLVHRDFKPENILVGTDNRPRVSDFRTGSLTTPPTAGNSRRIRSKRTAGPWQRHHTCRAAPRTGSLSAPRTGSLSTPPTNRNSS
jgi:serine/threonine protein kinase